MDIYKQGLGIFDNLAEDVIEDAMEAREVLSESKVNYLVTPKDLKHRRGIDLKN